MKNKEVYNYKIKGGAYQKMSSILKYSENGFAIVEDALCCITEVLNNSDNYLKSGKANLKNSNLYQIKIFNSRIDSEAVILPELLEDLPAEEWIIITKE
jgi:hypothetical protein